MRNPRDRRRRANRNNKPRQGEAPGAGRDMGEDRANPSSGDSSPERENIRRRNPEGEETVDAYDG